MEEIPAELAPERRARRRRELWSEVERLAEQLRRVPGVRRIVVFGSLADGEVGIASDIDLLVVQETDTPPRERQRRLYEQLDFDEALDLLVYTPEELERNLPRSSLLRRAIRTGRVLYEAT
jgi:predicted nucleotidyltransferase